MREKRKRETREREREKRGKEGKEGERERERRKKEGAKETRGKREKREREKRKRKRKKREKRERERSWSENTDERKLARVPEPRIFPREPKCLLQANITIDHRSQITEREKKRERDTVSQGFICEIK